MKSHFTRLDFDCHTQVAKRKTPVSLTVLSVQSHSISKMSSQAEQDPIANHLLVKLKDKFNSDPPRTQVTFLRLDI